jgi:UDP-N-acetylmuramate dehydrogenase
MPLPDATTAALEAAGLPVSHDLPLARKTWWQVGGPADGFVKVGTIEDLQAALRAASTTGCPVFVLGNGTNLLVSDRGIRGLVLQLVRDLARSRALPGTDPPRIQAGAGQKLAPLLQKALRHGWLGLEVFAGIPGTVGGAVRMNAGARLGETVDVLDEVDLVHPDGRLETLPTAALRMAYRTSHLPTGAVVARARLRTRAGSDADRSAMRAAVEHHLAHRASTQPLDQPSCGSTFRNPPGDHAGRLIEAAGLKGHRIGGVQVSEKHANFLVNTGGATADQVRDLIEHVQDTVEARFGVRLEREVHFAGDWSHRDA